VQDSCSCTIPIGLRPSPQLRAYAEGGSAAQLHQAATTEADCLGRSASAAYEAAPRLSGTGVLLPTWRRLAQLLALLNHQVPKPAQPVLFRDPRPALNPGFCRSNKPTKSATCLTGTGVLLLVPRHPGNAVPYFYAMHLQHMWVLLQGAEVSNVSVSVLIQGLSGCGNPKQYLQLRLH